MEAIKITWKSDYYPLGHWENANGQKINLMGNFHCKRNGQELVCVMQSATCGPGHGEPAITSDVPAFLDAVTLSPVEIGGGEFIEIDREEPARCAARWEEAERKREAKEAESERFLREKFGAAYDVLFPPKREEPNFFKEAAKAALAYALEGGLIQFMEGAGPAETFTHQTYKHVISRSAESLHGHFEARPFVGAGDMIFNPFKAPRKGGKK